MFPTVDQQFHLLLLFVFRLVTFPLQKYHKMSLWCDKHRPKNLAALDYHKEQAEQLKKLVT